MSHYATSCLKMDQHQFTFKIWPFFPRLAQKVCMQKKHNCIEKQGYMVDMVRLYGSIGYCFPSKQIKYVQCKLYKQSMPYSLIVSCLLNLCWWLCWSVATCVLDYCSFNLRWQGYSGRPIRGYWGIPLWDPDSVVRDCRGSEGQGIIFGSDFISKRP